MAVNVSALVIDCLDSAATAGYWQALLGGVLVPYDDLGVVALRAPGVTVDFVRVDDAKIVKNRWHLDLACDDHDRTVARALDLGGSIAEDVCVAEEFTVLRDPEGNEFCVLRHGSTAAPWAPPR